MSEFPEPRPKPRIVISKCIGFEACRYNGEIVEDKFVRRLAGNVEFICVCPEVEIGLGTPREAVRIVSAGDGFKLIQPASGLDLTRKMRAFTGDFLSSLSDVDGFILKTRSPSCGIGEVKYYAGAERAAPLGKTAGFFGGSVLERFGDRAIEDEGRLRNLGIREHFLTRIFAFSRLRQMQQSALMSELVRFHAENKLLLMAYNQTKMRELGRLVANGERETRELAVIESYGEQFRIALKKAPRHASPINALMHALGYFKKELSTREKKHFLGVLELYRGRKGVLLSSAVSVIGSWVSRFESEYLAGQSLFEPFPPQLMALDDSGKGRE